MIHANEPDESAGIEITPLIDMVFLLLIFFLVATTFHQSEREMQIALPSAAAAGPISTAMREIIVNVEQDGTIIVAGRTMQADDLSRLVTDAVANNPEQKVVVRGDRSTAYQNIVTVLDVCKAAGVQEPFLDTVVTGGS